MIDLAKSPDDHEEVLAYYPDVLFYVPKANLVIGTKGVWIEGVCVTSFQAGRMCRCKKSAATMK